MVGSLKDMNQFSACLDFNPWIELDCQRAPHFLCIVLALQNYLCKAVLCLPPLIYIRNGLKSPEKSIMTVFRGFL